MVKLLSLLRASSIAAVVMLLVQVSAVFADATLSDAKAREERSLRESMVVTPPLEAAVAKTVEPPPPPTPPEENARLLTRLQKAMAMFRPAEMSEAEKAAADPLSMIDAVKRAIYQNPELEIAMEQLNQAKNAVDEVRASYWPQATIKQELSREYNNPFGTTQGAQSGSGYNFSNNTSFSVRQMLYDGFVTREAEKQRKALSDSATFSQNKIKETLIKNTADIYMQIYEYQENEAAAAANIKALKSIAALVELRFKAGDAGNTEKSYMSARIAAAEQEFIKANATLKDAKSALTYLVADSQNIRAESPDFDSVAFSDTESILSKASESNTEIQIADAEIAAARHEYSSNNGKYMPTVDAVVDGNRSEDLGGTTGIDRNINAQVQVNFKVFDGGLRRATNARLLSRIKEVERRKERSLRQLKQEVTNAQNTLKTVDEALRQASEELSANAKLEKLYREQFQHGDVDITLLVESQERIFAAKLKSAKLQGDKVRAIIDLMRLTGQLGTVFGV
jgi:outer membrane protein, adhesin transport system